MNKVARYFKGRKPGWWIQNVLLVLAVCMLVFPSFRIWVISGIMQLTMRSPDMKVMENGRTFDEEEMGLVAEVTDGSILRIAEYQDKVIFLNIWATTCGPCVAEMSSIEDLYADYKDKVLFVMLSYEDLATIRGFQEHRGYDLPFCTPVAGVPDAFRTNRFPTTRIFNKKGTIVINESGAADWDDEDVRKLLDQLIAE
jgi:thiol-disulfide isomerase/thioredoxin